MIIEEKRPVDIRHWYFASDELLPMFVHTADGQAMRLPAGSTLIFQVHYTAGGKPVTLCGELASKPIGALALVALGYRDGPFEFPRRPFSWRLVASVVRHRETRLATAGFRALEDFVQNLAALRQH